MMIFSALCTISGDAPTDAPGNDPALFRYRRCLDNGPVKRLFGIAVRLFSGSKYP